MPSPSSTPTVTVLMATMNVARYLDEAIDSILRQTLADFELIIVDDGSSDDSWGVISRRAAEDGRILALRNEQNIGISRTLNKALAHARGAYITRQDGDDSCLPGRLAAQVAFLERHPQVGAVGTQATLIDREGVQIGLTTFPNANEDIQAILLDRMCMVGPTVMIRRSAMEAAGFYFYDEPYGQDYDICLRAAEVAEIVNLPEPLYYYRQHSASVSYAQRHRQMVGKAVAVQQAVARRYGAQPPAELTTMIARDYLRAGLLGLLTGNHAGCADAVEKANEVNQGVLDDVVLVEDLLRRYTPKEPVEDGVRFINDVFDTVLPDRPYYTRLRSKLLAEQHMHGVFSGLEQGRQDRVDEHLWQGIRQDPRWLLNRGIASLALKRSVATWAPGLKSKGKGNKP